MFIVTESDAAAIRVAFEADGEFSAAVELRRRFPGITNNGQARAIVSLTPLSVSPSQGHAVRLPSPDSPRPAGRWCARRGPTIVRPG